MIQVVNRALDIIEYVAIDAHRPKLMGEIAGSLSLNTATCANIIKTLTDREFLQKNNGSKGYILGQRLYGIVENTGNYKDLIEAADAQMLAVTLTLKENSMLAVLRGDNRIVIHKKNADQLVQANTADEKKAVDTSSGRLLISMQTDTEIENFIEAYGLPSGIWKEASSRKKFFDLIGDIRRKGYVLIEDSEQITGIAAPIYRNKKVVAAFSIYMPSFRCNDKVIKLIIKSGIDAANKISIQLNKSR